MNLADSPDDPAVRAALRAGFEPPRVLVGARDYLAEACDASLPKLWLLVSEEGSGSAVGGMVGVVW